MLECGVYVCMCICVQGRGRVGTPLEVTVGILQPVNTETNRTSLWSNRMP